MKDAYIYIYIYIPDIGRETWVQSQFESYQRLKKWYLMPPCLTLSSIRYGSRVKWSNPGKGVAPSPTPWCSKLSKREPSGHPRLWSPTFYLYIYISFTPLQILLCVTSFSFSMLLNLIFYIKIKFIILTPFSSFNEVVPRGVMVKAMDYRIVVSEFKLQSRY